MKDFLRPLLIGSVLVAISIVSRSEILLIPGLALVLPSLGGIAFEFLGLLENKFGTKFVIFLTSWFLTYGFYINLTNSHLPDDISDFIIQMILSLFFTIFLTYPLLSYFWEIVNNYPNDKNNDKDKF
jgi:hypothetical protein